MLFGKGQVFVLGAGPAGLLAAHAIAEARPKTSVTVFSLPDQSEGRPKKSELYGCQYLHQYIPGLDLPEAGQDVKYEVIGDPVTYKEKVYGHQWSGNTSVDEFGPEGSHLAWDLRKAYDELWRRYSSLVVPVLVNSNILRAMFSDHKAVIFSTIPARTVCINDDHEFKTQDVWAMGGVSPDWRPQRGENVPAQLRALPYYAPERTVQCNGSRDTAWYRAATVFGHSTIEWPLAKRPPLATIAAVRKPLSTDCTCWQENIRYHRVGRYGQWRKGVLVHTVYNQVKELMA